MANLLHFMVFTIVFGKLLCSTKSHIALLACQRFARTCAIRSRRRYIGHHPYNWIIYYIWIHYFTTVYKCIKKNKSANPQLVFNPIFTLHSLLDTNAKVSRLRKHTKIISSAIMIILFNPPLYSRGITFNIELIQLISRIIYTNRSYFCVFKSDWYKSLYKIFIMIIKLTEQLFCKKIKNARVPDGYLHYTATNAVFHQL